MTRFAMLVLFACVTSAQSQPTAYDVQLSKALDCLPEVYPSFAQFRRRACKPPLMAEQDVKMLVMVLQARYGTLFDNAELEKDVAKAAKERGVLLKARKLKAQDYEDAMLVSAPVKELVHLMISPLLEHDNAVYAGRVMLDHQESNGVLRGKLQYRDTVAYVILRVSKTTTVFDPLRLNTRVGVVGKYAGNARYQTVTGQQRIAPIIDVTHIGDPMEYQF